MLYAIPCAALTAALTLTLAILAAAIQRCRRLNRDLTRERVTARLDQAAWARDIEALDAQHRQQTALAAERAARAAADQAVLAEADAILDHALATTRTDTPRGGGSDG